MNLNRTLIGLALSCMYSFSTQLMATELSCPAQAHASKVCGTLTVTDFMGVPGTTPKFWIIAEDSDLSIRLGTYSNWGALAVGAYMRQEVCLYSDQESIEDIINIEEVCPN